MENREWSRQSGDSEEFGLFERPGPGELDVEDAFGAHDIEYWIWHDNRLIPASPDTAARLRELDALHRLHAWQRMERDVRRGTRRTALFRRAAGRLRTVARWTLGRGAILGRRASRGQENTGSSRQATHDTPTAFPHNNP
ncbi:MAG: hypothetical protein PVSMB4_01090 [Ktedonobacterales bacterium]